jgi:hypothetical protein
MPKFLKFILNGCAVVTALGCLVVLLALPIMGWSTGAQVGVWFPLLILTALHRVPIMLGEFVFVRSYLTGKSVIRELCKINLYVVFSLFLSSILCTMSFLYFLTRLADILQVNRGESFAWQCIIWGVSALIMSLVGVAEVYIKTDYFMEKHLTTNPKKVVTTLSAIIIPVYILWVAGLAFYVNWVLLPRWILEMRS